MVSVSGSTIAPPRPCTARAAISTSIEGASAAAADASVKIPRPATKILRRPNRSPSAAPVISRTANTSVYALTVHSSPPRLAWSSLRITGSADVTTRLSSVVMKTATEVIANVQMVVLRVFIVPPSLVVITHLLSREKKGRYPSSIDESRSLLAQGAGCASRSIDAKTLSSIPKAKKSRTRSGSAAETRST